MRLLSLAVFTLFFVVGGLVILTGYSKNNIVIAQSERKKPKNFKCLKCHKGSKSLENLAKEKEITSAEKLRFLIRKGPKSGLHVTVPDEDLEKAIQYLDLK
ncbi:MAG: hypothetical protein J7K20_07890 [Thermodesulfobacterium sp.]|nr:hypothetical protein [Thermodesulfobacterium sp.]